MRLKYNINGKIVRAWLGYFKDEIEIEKDNGDTDVKLPVKTDDGGDYFVYKNNKVYVNDFVKVSFEDFMQAVRNNMAFDDVFVNMLLSEGIDKIQFDVPMNMISSPAFFGICFADGDKFLNKRCRIIERQHKVVDNYKIEVEVLENDGSTIAHRSFYTSDMVSLIKDNYIKIYKVA